MCTYILAFQKKKIPWPYLQVRNELYDQMTWNGLQQSVRKIWLH